VDWQCMTRQYVVSVARQTAGAFVVTFASLFLAMESVTLVGLKAAAVAAMLTVARGLASRAVGDPNSNDFSRLGRSAPAPAGSEGDRDDGSVV